MGVKAALAAFDIFNVRWGRPLPGADGPSKAQTLRTSKDPAFYAQPLLSISIDKELRRTITVRRIDIFLPKVRWF